LTYICLGLRPNLRVFMSILLGVFFSVSCLAQETQIQEEGQELGRKALAEIRQDIQVSQQQMQQLAQEIEELEQDQHRLSEALVASAARANQLDGKLQAREYRLGQLLVEKAAQQRVLDARRGEITATLAVLERMSLRPPPALLVPIDETLPALRSSSLLGSVIIDLRSRAENLRIDIEKVSQLEHSIREEKTQIEAELQQSQVENHRLTLLLEARKNTHQHSTQQLAALQEQTAVLARRAHSLQDLIEELDRQEPADHDENILEKSIPVNNNFTQQQGRLALPVMGYKMQSFDKGHQGELYEIRERAMITTPVDGVIRYAGSFRSYGQMLIIDVGENHHLVLAGIDQLHVQQGQIVIAGEPIGSMLPESFLYIELRREGRAIDPAAWWQNS